MSSLIPTISRQTQFQVGDACIEVELTLYPNRDEQVIETRSTKPLTLRNAKGVDSSKFE